MSDFTGLTDFGEAARRALHENGYSLRAAARAVHYDVAYLSRVLAGRQPPSRRLAESLDRLLNTGGTLVEAATPPPAPGAKDTGEEVAALRAAASHNSAYDCRHGGDEVADATLRLWQAGRQRLEHGLVPERDQRGYLTALAETAALASWQLFDAGRFEQSRLAVLDAVLLARQAGDPNREFFALTKLALWDLETGQPRSALRIADEILTRPRVPPRVAALTHALRGWSYGQTGEHPRARAEAAAARGGLDRSVSPRDPEWCLRVGGGEFIGLQGKALLATARPEAAAGAFHQAGDELATAVPDGRGVLHYRVRLATAWARAGAWNECAAALTALGPLLPRVRSALSREHLLRVCHRLLVDRRTPDRLREQAHDTARAARSGPAGDRPPLTARPVRNQAPGR